MTTWIIKVPGEDFAYWTASKSWVRYQVCAAKFHVRRELYAARAELGPEARIVRLVPKQPATTDSPWAVFLHHRARLIHQWTCEGKSADEIARTLSMDPGQVRMIHGYVVDCPEDFRDKVKPVPVPMARKVAKEKRSVLPSSPLQTEKK